MPIDAYIDQFNCTSICVDNDPNKYHHTNLVYDFGQLSPNHLVKSFSFELTEDVPAIDVFTISIAQQGDRIKKDRWKKNQFKPCAMQILLYRDGDKKMLEGHNMRAFNNWLEIDKADLYAGKYTVTVKINQWNAAAYRDSEHKKVCLDIFCAQKDINLQVVEK